MTVNQMIDTREKLEDDVQDFYWRVLEWLDRQAAITERHWMEIVGASVSANVELKRQIDEKQVKLDELNAALNNEECKVIASSTDGLTTDNPKKMVRAFMRAYFHALWA